MIQGRFEFGDGAEDLSLAVIDGKGYVIWTTFNMTSTILDGTLGDVSTHRSCVQVEWRFTDSACF